MKAMTTPAILSLVLLFVGCSRVDDRPLAEKHLDITLDHIRTSGPDEEAAILVWSEAGWRRREEIADIALPYLKSNNADDVAGALAVLYRLRGYRPMQDLSSGPGQPTAWERKYSPGPFWDMLDDKVQSSLEHVYSLGHVRTFRNLALYLSAAPSDSSRRELLRIATETDATEQATICLAWYRDPQDMDSLLPFMLEDFAAARSLPYHFRNSYGSAALPYLEKAATEAKSETTRREASKELEVLKRTESTAPPAGG